MALVEKFFVVASEHPVDSNATHTIKEGQVVMINSSREIVLFDNGASSIVLGIAGDTKSASASAMPGIADGWQNRVNDGFNETGASGLMTVYENGGEFATDQYEDAVLVALPGVYLYGSALGKLTTTPSANSTPIAVLTRAAGPYPSGVPGTDINGDMALLGDHSNQYIEFKLLA